MLIILASPDALLKNGAPDKTVAKALIDAKAAGNPVAVVSNHTKPNWFDQLFNGSGVQFLQEVGRQSGEVISRNATKFNLQTFNVLVLAANDTDIRMGKNGRAVLAAAGWINDPHIGTLGIRVDNSAQFEELIKLSGNWADSWWFSSNTANYCVRALADLSKYYKPVNQQDFADKVTATVKNGGSRLNALLAVTARSLANDAATAKANLWGVYPSSKSSNQDDETLSDFTHRLRTTVTRVLYAERGEPLFIRHKHSIKRSSGGASASRTDPTDQLLTLHINSFYRGKIKKRNAVVVDDCTTYGVSFGVAAALLKAAGVASVTGVALGKFGNQLGEYDIQITGDPFAPLGTTDFKILGYKAFQGSLDSGSQAALLQLIP